jgi:uncharacterized protein DUF6163
VSDPVNALEPVERAREATPWTDRLVIVLRVLACFSLLKGLYHWTQVLGIGDGPGSTFQGNIMRWQAATIFFAVIDLVAAVGLWLAAAWGGVVWLTAAISMAAIELFFPQIYGGHLWIIVAEFAAILVYVGFALMAGRERPS